MADIEQDMDPNNQVPDNAPQVPYAPQDAAPVSTPAVADAATAPDGTSANTVASNDATNQPQVADNSDADEAAPAAESAPSTSGQQLAQGNPIPTPAEDAVQAHLDNIAFSKDLAGGAIKPETYHDLWANKSTLGKIGSLFGLLLAGAGSGLAHQSNSVLDMWNNEINRDVDAQKAQSKARQSFYTLAMQRQNNIVNNQAIAANTAAQRIGNVGKQMVNDRTAWTNRVIPGLTESSATADARNANWLTSVQDQQNNITNMADGPAKQKAQSDLDTVIRPFAMQQITKNNMDVASKKSLVNAIDPDPAQKLQDTADPRGPAINEQLLENKRIIGATDPTNPMGIPPAVLPAVIAAKNEIQRNRTNYADWMDMYRDLQNTKNAGQVPLITGANKLISGVTSVAGTGLKGLLGLVGGESLGAGIGQGINTLADLYERKRNVYKDSFKHRLGPNLSEADKEKQVDALFPSWIDKPNDPTVWNNGGQHFESNEAPLKGALTTYQLYKKFPRNPYIPPKSPNSSVSPSQEQPEISYP